MIPCCYTMSSNYIFRFPSFDILHIHCKCSEGWWEYKINWYFVMNQSIGKNEPKLTVILGLNRNACTKFNGNPSNSCGDISLRTINVKGTVPICTKICENPCSICLDISQDEWKVRDKTEEIWITRKRVFILWMSDQHFLMGWVMVRLWPPCV